MQTIILQNIAPHHMLPLKNVPFAKEAVPAIIAYLVIVQVVTEKVDLIALPVLVWETAVLAAAVVTPIEGRD